jgi:ubiquitin thioesterase OTU1
MECQTPNKDGMIMIRRVIDSDNSCLFNSIGLSILGSKREEQNLRKRVKEAIMSDQESFTPLLDKPLDEYCEWIMKNTSWGGGVELYILSTYFETQMAVINIETLNTVIYGEESGYSKRIYLLYSGVHYDAITRNIYDEASESNDERAFDVGDKYAYEGALFVASELRKKKQYTNIKDFSLICSICYFGCKGQKDALEHAKTTGHQNFQESSDFAL